MRVKSDRVPNWGSRARAGLGSVRVYWPIKGDGPGPSYSGRRRYATCPNPWHDDLPRSSGRQPYLGVNLHVPADALEAAGKLRAERHRRHQAKDRR
jgi:hypothetical protein